MKILLPVLMAVWLCAGAFAQKVVDSKSVFLAGEGVNGKIFAIVVQPDGKIVVGGNFSSVNGESRGNIARINADGTLDRTFCDQRAAGVNGPVFALVLHPSGGVIAGGSFTMAGNILRMNLVRFNDDGSVDKKYADAEGGQVTNGPVSALAVQTDGKLVLGGSFTVVQGNQRQNVARLNPDGTLDKPIAPQDVINGKVQALAPLSGARVVVGGIFNVEGKTAQNIFRTEN